MHARRVTLSSPKLKKQKRKKHIIFFSVFFGVVFLLCVLIYVFFNLDIFLIKEINITGNEVTDTDNINNIVSASISGKYFYLIPKNNKFLYPKSEVVSNIKESINRIEDISVDVYKNTLNVSIGERNVYGLWCKESDCYFMDMDGYIFSKAPNFSSGVYIVFEGVIFDDNPVGKYFLNTEKILLVNSLINFFKDNNLKVTKVKIGTEKDTEIHLKKGFFVKVDLTKSVEDSVKILNTLISSKEFSESVSDLASLEYIDIRFGNKVFFKQRNSSVSGEF